MMTPPPRHRYADCTVSPFHDSGPGQRAIPGAAPSSGAWSTASMAVFYPLALPEGMAVSKAFVVNGATVGTDSWDIGVYRMTDQTTGRMDLIRSTGANLSAGTINVAVETATWRVGVNTTAITSGNDSTDSTTYTTASVTLKAGRLYTFSISNTAASAGAISSISGGPTWSAAAPGTSTTQYNTAAHRVSIWTGVPTTDYTGTIVVTFGATQTGATWAVNEFSGVDTSSNNGVVQAVVGSGSSTTPLATLAAVGASSNICFGALSNSADTTTTPGTGFTELSDTNAATPVNCLQTEWSMNDTTVDGTITSGPWGAVALEIKADTGSFVIPPSMPGTADIYMAMVVSGVTATIFRTSPARQNGQAAGLLQAATAYPLPSTCTGVAITAVRNLPLAGFSSRSLLA